MSIFMLKIEAA